MEHTKVELDISSDIKLQSLSVEHAKMLFCCVQDSRTSLEAVLPWVNDIQVESDARRYIETRINNSVGGLWSAIEFKQQFCGVFGIKYVDPKAQNAEVGYWLGAHARGHGIIGQVLTQVIAKLRAVSDIKSIEFQCLASNTASQRIITKAGGQLIGSVTDQTKTSGDEALYVYRLWL
ncbi:MULTISPECIES: GNAT family N-acetyltransferase [unclassified Pseudoalteromonas]|uniref:GNAT family N-acetyltransferase n=1 Tax=unclassified Pseudoalteromonas TaxID=194690 RepID=UPI001F4FB439|nr:MULTISPECIES: GNAT family N-acetyltransferase [unclassified Pseudoalteromonas]